MAGKALFAEQAEEFTAVVNTLLQNARVRAEFAKAPLDTLKRAGIAFKDDAIARRVGAELEAIASGSAAGMPGPDDVWPPRYYARATSIAWDAKPGDIDDVITIDRIRVDAFVNQVALETKVSVLEKKIVALETALAMH